MVGLIRAEFRKLSTTQVWFWMLLLCVGLTILGVVGGIAGQETDLDPRQFPRHIADDPRQDVGMDVVIERRLIA